MSKGQQASRLAFIELLVWWEGEVRNRQLQNQFNISRQQAYHDIKTYLNLYPDNLKALEQGYGLSDIFSPQYIQPCVEEYFHWLHTRQFLFKVPQQVSLVRQLALPSRNVQASVIRGLVKAIREQQRVDVDYVSLANPEYEGRVFTPHSFVNTGLRWHVRGYCEKSCAYRDLVLSRFRGSPELLGSSPHAIEHDIAWQTKVAIVLQPDPRLSPQKQDVLANDYQMEGGQLVLSTRAALATYLLHELQVNTKMLDGTPEAQQLVLVNLDDIKPWLFNH